jgi:hypothetical protein
MEMVLLTVLWTVIVLALLVFVVGAVNRIYDLWEGR